MKHRSSTRRSFLLAALCVLCGLPWLVAGCGGGGNGGGDRDGGTGRLTLTVQWPEPSRLIPAASTSIRATLTRGGATVDTRTLQRPAAAPWTTDVTFENLAPGDLVLSAAAFPNADATGTAQASGAAPAAIVAGQTTTVRVTMASTIARIAVSPANPSVPVGGQQAYTATAYDAADAVVLVSPATLSWQSGGTGIATVDAATGVATGVAPGSAQIIAAESESGKSGAAAITVTSGQQGDFAPHPTAAAVAAGAQYLYLVEQGDAHLGGTYRGGIQRFRVNADGTLSLLSPPVTGGGLDRPHQIVAHPSQPFVYVADNTRLYQYRVNADGTLAPLSPANATVSRGTPIAMGISPDGAWVATHSKAAAIADSPVDLFRVEADGTLTRTTTAPGNSNVSGADIAGNVALTAGRADGRFVVASRRASFGGGVDVSGLFTMAVPDSGVPMSPRSYVQERAYGMTIDRSSTYLFVTLDTPGEGRAIGDALVVTYRITTTGNHQRLEVENAVGTNTSQFPRSLVCEPSGRFLYVQNFTEDSLSQFRIEGDGTLTRLAEAVAAPNPVGMAAHPGGGFLYVPNYEGRDGTAVTPFRINGDGTLAPL